MIPGAAAREIIPATTATVAGSQPASPATMRRSNAIGVLKDEGLIRTRPSWGTFVVPEAERPKG